MTGMGSGEPPTSWVAKAIGRYSGGLFLKVVLVAVAIQAVAVGGIALWYGHWFVKTQEEAAVSHLERVGDLIATGAVRMDVVADPAEFSLLAGEAMIEGMVVSADGYVIIASDKTKTGRQVDTLPGVDVGWFADAPGPRVVAGGQGSGELVVAAPLYFVEAARPNLFLLARISQSQLARKVDEIVAFVAITSILVFVLSSVAIVYSVHRGITKDVHAVSRVVDRITSGDLSARAPETARDRTLLVLQKGVNALAAEVARHRAGLEEQVRQRTRELTVARNQLDAIINVVPQGIIAYCDDRPLVISNPQADDMFPAALAETSDGTGLPAIIATLRSGRTDDLSLIDGRLDGNGSFEGDFEIETDRWVRIQIRRTDQVGTVICASDITTYKMAEHSLARALEKERELNELQKSFVSMASHQFRTPLAIIDSAAQRIARTAGSAGPEETRGRVDRIRSSIERLTLLVDNTLSAARMDAEEITINQEDFDLTHLLESSLDRFEEANPEYRFERRFTGLPDRFAGDRNLLREVIDNVLSNALKYSPENRMVMVDGHLGDKTVEISVTDQGIGIDQEDLPRIFQRFFRARSAAGLPGTGLGLSVARDFVELHGGSMSLQSRRGEGTRVTISLPLRQETAVTQKAGAADG